MKKNTLLSAIGFIALTSCQNSTTPKTITYQVNGVKFNMVEIDGGRFKMGAQNQNPEKDNYDSNAYDYEGPVHKVIVGDFLMGETEVTQGLWKAVMKDSSAWSEENGKGDNLPVYFVTYDDCIAFIAALNDSLSNSKQLSKGKKFSLPTEAQWEYAARGGRKGGNLLYAGSNNLTEVGWFQDNAEGKLHPVGQKKPNELGLYDINGNVWEWCNDFYGNYQEKKETNPTGPESGNLHILRGGGYGYDAHGARNTCRGYNVAKYKDRNLGFRLVLK